MNMAHLLNKPYVNGSLWKSKTYTKNPASPLRYFKAGIDLSKDVLWIPVGQMAAKIQVEGLEKIILLFAT